MTLPSATRTAIGIAEGDLVEATILRGKIVLTPKPAVVSSDFPKCGRRVHARAASYIDARPAKSDEDITRAASSGPSRLHRGTSQRIRGGEAENDQAPRAMRILFTPHFQRAYRKALAAPSAGFRQAVSCFFSRPASPFVTGEEVRSRL